MNLIYQDNCDNINWEEIPRLLKLVGMSFVDKDIHRVSFENSYTVIFVFDNSKLIGFGRVISDGVRQAALYDIAIDPVYQGQGIGRSIVHKLMANLSGCNCILYASPGKEGFYRKLGFKRMKTAMGIFADPTRMDNEDFFDTK